ncbi:hypothetical protein ACNVED_13050 [Legionella sp. D16C41]|uniref:hypothetical protein n=1 Tax=Legionella sp. D16C41 TaxID=3402688 RepID=UPI003AF6A7C9
MKTIVIAGVDGAGKTTLCNALEKLLQLQGYKVEVATIWDILDKNLFIAPVSKQNIPKYLQALSSQARSLFLLHGMAQAIHVAQKENPQLLIINSYWYKYYITELLHGAPRSDLDAIVKIFPKPDLVYYLDISPATLLKRKEVISAYESGNAEDRKKGFLSFQKNALQEWDKIKQPNWKTLDTNLSIEDLACIVFEDIQKEKLL